MRLNESLGVDCVKICPDCGEIGPRLINRCPACEAIYQKAEKARQEREAARRKVAQRRANGFDEGWD